MAIIDFLTNSYSKLPLENTYGNFYYLIEQEFKEFLSALKNLDSVSIEETLKPYKRIEHFKAPYTKQRLINLLKKICNDLLNVLALCYKGDLFSANMGLRKFLTNTWKIYLVEYYRNNLSFDLEEINKTFYRMRDENEYDQNGSPVVVSDCNHVPFEKRMYAATGRYNLYGYPCLYLGDSKETCDAEIGRLEKDIRYVWEFIPKKSIPLYDLRIPSVKEINKEDGYGLFKMLLAYPLIALCSTKDKHKGFNEKYFIPQLLFHHILMGQNNAFSHKGIAYSSTKHRGGYNIVIPAFYSSSQPQMIGHSAAIKELFEEKHPKKYKQHYSIVPQ